MTPLSSFKRRERQGAERETKSPRSLLLSDTLRSKTFRTVGIAVDVEQTGFLHLNAESAEEQRD